KTDRGIRVVADGLGKEPSLLFIQAQEFTDPEQIFHEIRMNWRKPLYLECVFPEAWQRSQYLSVLEDNRFAPWNEELDHEVGRAIDQYFNQEEQTQRMALLKA
ncbi:YpiB family protein, partial [Enterococcus faecalis]|uniref:YpiB family protein n=1 Tax=Enterococcus faecalis TaxID=1351 RepID=UPI003D6A4724